MAITIRSSWDAGTRALDGQQYDSLESAQIDLDAALSEPHYQHGDGAVYVYDSAIDARADRDGSSARVVIDLD